MLPVKKLLAAGCVCAHAEMEGRCEHVTTTGRPGEKQEIAPGASTLWKTAGMSENLCVLLLAGAGVGRRKSQRGQRRNACSSSEAAGGGVQAAGGERGWGTGVSTEAHFRVGFRSAVLRTEVPRWHAGCLGVSTNL
jgi:hypothetical protein